MMSTIIGFLLVLHGKTADEAKALANEFAFAFGDRIVTPENRDEVIVWFERAIQ